MGDRPGWLTAEHIADVRLRFGRKDDDAGVAVCDMASAALVLEAENKRLREELRPYREHEELVRRMTDPRVCIDFKSGTNILPHNTRQRGKG